MKVLRVVGIALLAIVGLVAVVVLMAPQSDGPIGPLPGGPLLAGTMYDDEVSNWAFAQDLETIEMQLLSQDRSRNVWILVHEGNAYVPCSLGFPPGKTWHEQALVDGRSILRIEGLLYPTHLRRVEDQTVVAELMTIAAGKYEAAPPGGGDIWFFRIEPEPS